MAICKCRRCCLFFFGAGVGAAAGILLAPKSGQEIRRELFGGSPDLFAEPGAEEMPPQTQSPADLKARIDETRARLKAEVEAEQDNKES